MDDFGGSDAYVHPSVNCPVRVMGCRRASVGITTGVPQIVAEFLQRPSRQSRAKSCHSYLLHTVSGSSSCSGAILELCTERHQTHWRVIFDLGSRRKARSASCTSEPGGPTRDRPTGQLSTCANGNVTCGSPAALAMLMRQRVGRVKPAKLDSTPRRGAMSDVVGIQITPSSPMRFWTNVRSAAQWVRASCHASDILQQDVEIQGGAAPEIQCMRLQKDLSGPSPLVVQQREEFPFRVDLGGSAELR